MCNPVAIGIAGLALGGMQMVQGSCLLEPVLVLRVQISVEPTITSSSDI